MVFGRWLQRGRRNRWAVDQLHRSILKQALRQDFYDVAGVRDNFSGRFEMTSLHAVLAFRRLRSIGGVGRDMAQDCFDALFDGFDEALRDIGTGDLTVGKKIRKMGEAYYGRSKSYEEALAPNAPPELLEAALVRNLGIGEGEPAARFVRYVHAVQETLARHPDESMLSGDLSWPKPPV